MELIHNLFGTSWTAAFFIIANLFLVESLLSIDNAAVLATMVRKLKTPADQAKALHYGIWGAIIMRGACMILAAWLTQLWVLKVAGGLYLCYLCYGHFKPGKQTIEEGVTDDDPDKSAIVLFAEKYLKLNHFWATVILVELMDMAFSVDNIFAAVAFTKFTGLICLGVFIGIFAMRYVAQSFVKLMDKFPFLENVAYIVIGILGIKLALSLFEHLWPESVISKVMLGEHIDLIFSLLTLAVFLIPVLWAYGKHKWFTPPDDGGEEVPTITDVKLNNGGVVTVSTLKNETKTVTTTPTEKAA